VASVAAGAVAIASAAPAAGAGVAIASAAGAAAGAVVSVVVVVVAVSVFFSPQATTANARPATSETVLIFVMTPIFDSYSCFERDSGGFGSALIP